MPERPQRNLSLELVRATEAAAIVAARYRDARDWEHANAAASQAMHAVLQTIDMNGVVIIGEGEKREVPLLFHGAMVGTSQPPAVDIALDAIEGEPSQALSRPNTLALVALAERWTLWDPGPSLYVEQMVVGPSLCEVIDLSLGITENLRRIAKALQCTVNELTVFMLDEPHQQALLREVREAGARVELSGGGFVAGSILAAMPDTGIDVMLGIGRSTEAVLAACAVKALDGRMHVRRAPQSPQEEANVRAALGERAGAILTESDLCKSEDVFFAATGITDGRLVHGVEFRRREAITESFVLRRRSGTIRYVRAIHRLNKLMEISQIDYLHTKRE